MISKIGTIGLPVANVVKHGSLHSSSQLLKSDKFRKGLDKVDQFFRGLNKAAKRMGDQKPHVPDTGLLPNPSGDVGKNPDIPASPDSNPYVGPDTGGDFIKNPTTAKETDEEKRLRLEREQFLEDRAHAEAREDSSIKRQTEAHHAILRELGIDPKLYTLLSAGAGAGVVSAGSGIHRQSMKHEKEQNPMNDMLRILLPVLLVMARKGF